MLSIKDLSANKELDRAAMGAVAGGNGAPSFALSNYANDLIDFLGAAQQSDVTSIINANNYGTLVFNYVDADKHITV